MPIAIRLGGSPQLPMGGAGHPWAAHLVYPSAVKGLLCGGFCSCGIHGMHATGSGLGGPSQLNACGERDQPEQLRKPSDGKVLRHGRPEERIEAI